MYFGICISVTFSDVIWTRNTLSARQTKLLPCRKPNDTVSWHAAEYTVHVATTWRRHCFFCAAEFHCLSLKRWLLSGDAVRQQYVNDVVNRCCCRETYAAQGGEIFAATTITYSSHHFQWKVVEGHILRQKTNSAHTRTCWRRNDVCTT